MFGDDGQYYYDECERRLKCQMRCNEDFFPELYCSTSGYSFTYQGNEYDDLYFYNYTSTDNFAKCSAYVDDNEDYEDSPEDSDRTVRLHTCFPACTYGEDSNFEDDTRPRCKNSFQEENLVCVNPSDDCEEVFVPNAVGSGLRMDGVYAIVAIVIANIFQYVFLFLCIFTQSLPYENIDRIRMMSSKCLAQIAVLIYSAASIFIAIWRVILIHKYGPADALWGTFLFAFGLDQVKSFFFHCLIWYLLIRRCGYLKPNEENFVNPDWALDRKDTAFIYYRQECGKFLENSYYEASSIVFLLIYGVFVLIVLSMNELINDDLTLNIIDQAFLSAFLLEILVKASVQGISYFADGFNTFDFIVVLVSFIMFFLGIAARGLAALRLLRLVRLVIILRKVSAKTKRKSKNNFSTAAEESVYILKQVRQFKKLTFRQKKELVWAIDIIATEKLYELTMSNTTDKNSGNTSTDLDARRWVSLAQKSSNDPLKWFDRDLDDYLFERQRNGEPGENKDMDDDELRLRVSLPEKTHFQLDKIFDDIGKWRFNAFQYYDLCGEQTLTHFIIRLFQFYDIVNKFSVPMDNLKRLAGELYKGYASNNPYHNAIHAVDVTHKLNYFILTGNLMKYISDLDIMASLLASVIHDFQHPGVSNKFLVEKRHKKALRYNDHSVLELHHLASAFAVLLEQDCDITISLTEDQFWVLRSSIIKMVLNTDIRAHETLLGTFSNSVNKPNFPNNDEEKQNLLNMALRVADYGNALQPTDLYFKWMALFMEELYQQGDIEKHLGMEFSNSFYDRTSTNPYSNQLGYIEVLVEPIAIVWCDFLPEIKEDLITRGLEENKQLLRQKDAEAVRRIQSNEYEMSEQDPRRSGALSGIELAVHEGHKD
eukprot:CAMPEP_0204903912 /NCGR_PEP_ID=MMETSP1397-20131031/4558_1 /ASSEMBLY_ACC=CAM_ASM_000891 /TAXON_ID=49980 /ORGANISM="Climacostomum Climacostomum virens, Strain Stock W-24" /LENGTH=879 /DNA_ID=CAMNT_0052072627 /DNA_START=171 /DNA_END=2810 /DNA_ORIENTATION=+